MQLLRVDFKGWSATPRMPFILSGNAICLPVPSYSLILGIIGCCLGRHLNYTETNIGFLYSYDSYGIDMETRQRLVLDKKSRKIKAHHKGSDAYPREFHINPKLTLWLNRLDWKALFETPLGTPALGRSQDLLQISNVEIVQAKATEEAKIAGTMIPFRATLKIPGQIVQMAEAFTENDRIGAGRTPVKSKMFLALHHNNPVKIKHRNLFSMETGEAFYLHDWQ